MIGVLAMKNQIIEKIFRVVIYLRLSDEDGDNQESDSISNQRILNRGFLEGKQEFQIVKSAWMMDIPARISIVRVFRK